jgi:hypothetical protein
VQRERRKARLIARLVSIFGLGAVVGACATGVLLGVFADVLPAPPRNVALGSLIGVCLLFAALDASAGYHSRCSLRRQTCSTWYRRFGEGRTFLIWGFDLGLAFSTIRVSGLFWVVAIADVLFVAPASSPLVLTGYGLGLTFSVATAVALATKQDAPKQLRTVLLLSAPTVRRALTLLMPAFALVVVYQQAGS